MLESLHSPDMTPCLAELAHHGARGAGAPEDIEKAIDYSIRGGDATVAAFAHEDATVHFRAAVELEGQCGGNLLRRAELACTASGSFCSTSSTESGAAP